MAFTVADILAKGSVSFAYDGEGADIQELVAEESISVDLSLWEAAEKLAASGGRALPVVQDGKVVGLIRKADIVHALQKLGAPD